MMNNIKTLTNLYQYFDQLVENDVDADTLFASSYIRGFIAVEAVNFGDDNQILSSKLYHSITDKMHQAKTELTPQDGAIVGNFWLSLQANFNG